MTHRIHGSIRSWRLGARVLATGSAASSSRWEGSHILCRSQIMRNSLHLLSLIPHIMPLLCIMDVCSHSVEVRLGLRLHAIAIRVMGCASNIRRHESSVFRAISLRQWRINRAPHKDSHHLFAPAQSGTGASVTTCKPQPPSPYMLNPKYRQLPK